MKLVKVNGGHSIAVYQEDIQIAKDMIMQGRVDYIAFADYSKGSKLEQIVYAVLDQIKSTDITIAMHLADEDIDKCK
jgi:hypothetical protein